MTPKERDIAELKNKIAGSEEKLKNAHQHGPLVLACVGIALCLTLVTGLSLWFFGIGFILVLSAVVWAYFRTKETVKLKEAIFHDTMEIYRIENKP